jgi:transcription elongation factor Elf1
MSFTRKIDLDRHRVGSGNPDGSDKFVCAYCATKFCNFELLRTHIWSYHFPSKKKVKSDQADSEPKRKEEPESIRCEKCEEVFTSRDYLVKHLEKHQSNEEFKCDLCNTKFLWRKTMKRHKIEMFDTDGSPKHVCEMCGIHVCTGKLLRAHHISVHRNFICPACGQSFTLKRNLDSHVKNKIEFSCSECGKTFCNKRAYKQHMIDVHFKFLDI